MEHVIRTILAALLALVSIPSAFALGGPTLGGPALGLWAHPGDGGRGFNIDLQGDLMIVTTFIYTQTGAPIWYLSSGIYNHDTGRFSSSYDSYSNGQCFGCPPNQPVVTSGAAGNMSIQFHNNREATITTPAGSLSIRKFDYGFGSLRDMMQGEWSYSINLDGAVLGDWLVFTGEYVGSDGTVYASGYVDGSETSPALATVIESSGTMLIVAESPDGQYYHWYEMAMDAQRAFGEGWVTRASATPSGDGLPAVGSRLLYHAELGANARGAAKRTGTASHVSTPINAAAADISRCSAASCVEHERFHALRDAFEEVQAAR